MTPGEKTNSCEKNKNEYTRAKISKSTSPKISRGNYRYSIPIFKNKLEIFNNEIICQKNIAMIPYHVKIC